MLTPPRSSVLGLLLVLSAIAACNGGGGGGGGDDDDTPPPTPARPGWVVLRLQQTLSIVEADGPATALVDVTAPAGIKTLVDFSADDRVIYRIATGTTNTAGDIYIVNNDGATNNTLLATGVSDVFGWADATHLLVQKGKGPSQSPSPTRDIYVVPIDGGGEVAVANDPLDEEFGGLAGSTLVFRRGPITGEANLFAAPALGGAVVPLTTEAGPEVFAGFTASNRVVYTANGVINSDVYSVQLAGTGKMTLADGPNPEFAARIQGERVIIQEVVPTMDASEGNVHAVNSDGTQLVDLSSTADLPENVVGITPNGHVLISLQSSFDPVVIDLLSVPSAGGAPVTLGSIVGGGVDAVLGESVLLHGGTPAEITAIESDGSNSRTLATAATDTVFKAATSSRVIYSVDEGGGVEKLWTVALAGGGATQLRPDPGADTFAAVLANMVVITIPGVGNQTDIVAANTAGGDLRTLAAATDTEQFRGITPDGRVIFSRRRGPFLDDLYIVNGDGTGEIGLTERADADVFLGFLP